MDSNIINFPNSNSSFPTEQFDGLSEKQINALVSTDFESGIITITHDNEIISQIPLIKQIRFFVHLIKEEGEIKLTKVGNLPPIIVKSIYAQRFILDDAIEHEITKLTKETDCNSIVLTRTLCEQSGLVKNRNNTLSLTKKCLNIIESGDLLKLIMTTFCTKFSWAYFDAYENEQLGQVGCNYSLYLLAKYGDEEREVKFYSNKYFDAYPEMLTELSYDGTFNQSHHCYVLRTFERFLAYFGFLTLPVEMFRVVKIQKTNLFDSCISIRI